MASEMGGGPETDPLMVKCKWMVSGKRQLVGVVGLVGQEECFVSGLEAGKPEGLLGPHVCIIKEQLPPGRWVALHISACIC